MILCAGTLENGRTKTWEQRKHDNRKRLEEKKMRWRSAKRFDENIWRWVEGLVLTLPLFIGARDQLDVDQLAILQRGFQRVRQLIGEITILEDIIGGEGGDGLDAAQINQNYSQGLTASSEQTLPEIKTLVWRIARHFNAYEISPRITGISFWYLTQRRRRRIKLREHELQRLLRLVAWN